MSRPEGPEDSLREEALEYHSGDESDLIYQLGDKIRLQAKRLATLEQYKLLCERRVLELCPGHPMPVRQEHLGKEGTDGRLLHAALQKVARLEQQIAQGSNSPLHSLSPDDLRQLISEKVALEESLRTEMFLSEELRAQVEVLKQALEEKMAMFGLPGDLQSVTELMHLQENYEIFKKENIELKSSLHSHSDFINSLKSTISSLQTENSAISTQLDTLNEQKSTLLNDLQVAQDALSRMETMNKALNQQINELEAAKATQKDIISALESSHSALKEDYHGLERKHTMTYQSLSHSEQETKEIIEKYQKSLLEIDEFNSQIEEMETELKEKIGKLDREMGRNKEISEELSREKVERGKLEEEVRRLEREVKEEQETQKETVRSLEREKAAKETKENEVEAWKTQVQGLKKDLEAERATSTSLHTHLEQLKAELYSSQSQVASYQSAFQSAKQDIGGRDGEIADLKRALQIMKDTNTAALASAKSREDLLTSQLSDLERTKLNLESALNSAKDAISRLESAASDHQKRYFELENRLYEAKIRIEQLEQEGNNKENLIEELENKGKMQENHKEKTEELLKSANSQLEVIFKEKQALESELSTKNDSFSTLKSAFSLLKQEKSVLESDLSSSTSQLSQLKSDFQHLTTENSLFSSENSALKGRVAELQEDIGELQGLVTEGRRREKTLEGNCREMEKVVKGNIESLVEVVQPFEAVFGEGEERREITTLEDAVASISLVLSAAEARVVEGDRTVQALSMQVRELSEGRDNMEETIRRLETAVQTHANAASEMYLELQTTKQHLLSERDLRSQQNDEYQALNHHFSQAKSELTELRLRLRDSASEVGMLQTQGCEQGDEIEKLQGILQDLEGRLMVVTTEKRRAEGLLGRFVRTVPAPGEMKRVVLDIMQTHTDLSDIERMKDLIRTRLQALENSDSPTAQEALAAEQTSLSRSEAEESALLKRLQLLEAELEELAYRVSPRDMLLNTGKMSARTEPRSNVQFDPRISPYLTDSIRKRLSEGRSPPSEKATIST